MDGGHSNWLEVNQAAELLKESGIEMADGFTLNVSNFQSTEDLIKYGEELSALLGGIPYIIDTSRNGLGADPSGEWCNPPGRGLGEQPGFVRDPNAPHLLARAWIKPPWQSDGNCNGAPPAGEFYEEYIYLLYDNSPVF